MNPRMIGLGVIFLGVSMLSPAWGQDVRKLTLEAEIAVLDSQITTLSENIRKLETKLPQVPQAAAQERMRNDIAKFKGELDTSKAQLSAKKTALKEIDDQIREGVTDAVKKAKTATTPDGKVANLQEEVNQLELKAKSSDLKFRLNDLERYLDSIERRFDDSVLGDYTQQKLKKLLESKNLCAAIAKCGAKVKSVGTSAGESCGVVGACFESYGQTINPPVLSNELMKSSH